MDSFFFTELVNVGVSGTLFHLSMKLINNVTVCCYFTDVSSSFMLWVKHLPSVYSINISSFMFKWRCCCFCCWWWSDATKSCLLWLTALCLYCISYYRFIEKISIQTVNGKCQLVLFSLEQYSGHRKLLSCLCCTVGFNCCTIYL